MKKIIKIISLVAVAMAMASCYGIEVPDNWKDINSERLQNHSFKTAVGKIDKEQTWNVASNRELVTGTISAEDVQVDGTKVAAMSMATKAAGTSKVNSELANFFWTNTNSFKVSVKSVDAAATITIGIYYYDKNYEMKKMPLWENFKQKDLYKLTTKNVKLSDGNSFGFYLESLYDGKHSLVYSEARLNEDNTIHTQLNTFTSGSGKNKTTSYTVGFEDMDGKYGADWDYNDVELSLNIPVQEYNGGIFPLDLDMGPWMLLCEDLGESADNDFNDAVFAVHRVDATHIRVEYCAAGATRSNCIYFNGNLLGEIHALMGVPIDWNQAYSSKSKPNWFINTKYYNGQRAEGETTWTDPVFSDLIEVDKDFTMDNLEYGGFSVVSQGMSNVMYGVKGYAPYMIVIPAFALWPAECCTIFDAYPNFREWAQDHTKSTDWYMYPNEKYVVEKGFMRD